MRTDRKQHPTAANGYPPWGEKVANVKSRNLSTASILTKIDNGHWISEASCDIEQEVCVNECCYPYIAVLKSNTPQFHVAAECEVFGSAQSVVTAMTNLLLHISLLILLIQSCLFPIYIYPTLYFIIKRLTTVPNITTQLISALDKLQLWVTSLRVIYV